MSNEKIIFSMAGVSKIYPPNKTVLKDIYLSFFYGAKIGVLGLNGSGKSSLLRIIAGIDKEIRGEVVFDGSYSIGLLEQEPDLDKDKTVRQVVEEGVQEVVDMLAEFEAINEKFADPEVLENPDAMNDLIEKQAKVQEKLDQMNAWELETRLERAMDALRTPPGEARIENLSGGENRILEIYLIIASETKFCMLDEPFSHVMPLHVDTIKSIINKQKNNKGIMLADHLYEHIIDVCDEIYVILNGKTYFTRDRNDLIKLGYINKK